MGDGADNIPESGKVENLRQKHMKESICWQVLTISKFIKHKRQHRDIMGKVLVIFGGNTRQFTPRKTAAVVWNRQ